jgi:DNA polymerase-1
MLTPGGAPKVCEENLNTLKEDAPPELQLIKRCKVLKSRSTLIQSYLDACGDDGRVHGQVVSIGAGTHRMAHRNPNSGNIPSKGIYGEVCRQMFTVCPGRKLVGCDAANIQFRILAHYLKNDELIDQIVNKDMHYYFSQMYGLNPKDREYDSSDHDLVSGRKKGKTCTFAIIMGAGVGKIGQILGSAEKGREAFDNLKKNIKGWTKFHKEIEYRAGLGYFIGLDGRKVPLKSAHFGMSSYLQAGEAIIMKRAMVESFKEIKKKGLDAFQVAVVHDEMQYDCAEDCAEEVGNILRRHIIEAGEYYKLCCPLDGEYVIGNNWLETH